MLVLSRKIGQRIQIGNNVVVEVRRIAGNRVSLAFSAPDDVRILRSELDPFSEEDAEAPSRNGADARHGEPDRRQARARRDLAVH
jgi:carbon storage regulator